MRTFHLAVLSLIIGSFGLVPAGTAAASTFTVLWSFSGPLGARPPDAALFAASKGGPLFGTTLYGGARRRGTVFELTPPAALGGSWRMKVLWSFSGRDGAYARPGLIERAPDGRMRALYGTTEAGGNRPADAPFGDTPVDRDFENPFTAPDAQRAGTVFRLTPPTASNPHWTETVLHSFAGKDGARPNGPLLTGPSGALYGTTAYGGAHGQGTVFKLSPPTAANPHWTETVLYSFAGPDGAHPSGGLIFDAAGTLYGTTLNGGRGVEPHGIVFKLSPPSASNPHWTEMALHSFAGPDGAQPEAGLVFDKSGALYGITSWGGSIKPGGEVYKLTPPSATEPGWTETTLHYFHRGEGDVGWHPMGRVILDASGALYGTTHIGRAFLGAAYKLTPARGTGSPWALTVLRVFSLDDGGRSKAGLIAGPAGVLYGTTQSGGEHDVGTVFRVTTD